ncbi:hypothetical protein P9112_008025 [Eukaryota sp. TZLM1-RC]
MPPTILRFIPFLKRRPNTRSRRLQDNVVEVTSAEQEADIPVIETQNPLLSIPLSSRAPPSPPPPLSNAEPCTTPIIVDEHQGNSQSMVVASEGKISEDQIVENLEEDEISAENSEENEISEDQIVENSEENEISAENSEENEISEDQIVENSEENEISAENSEKNQISVDQIVENLEENEISAENSDENEISAENSDENEIPEDQIVENSDENEIPEDQIVENSEENEILEDQIVENLEEKEIPEDQIVENLEENEIAEDQIVENLEENDLFLTPFEPESLDTTLDPFESLPFVAGVFIFRIFQLYPVLIPSDLTSSPHFSFFNGDSYLVLKSRGISPSLTHTLHVWIGSKTGPDVAGAAARWALLLNQELNLSTAAIREEEGFESDLFKSYFDEINIVSGGCGSTFRPPKPPLPPSLFIVNDSECGLPLISPCQATTTDFIQTSSPKHCYILSTNENVVSIIGDSASSTVRARTLYAARLFLADYAGRSKLKTIYLSEFKAGFDPLCSFITSNLCFNNVDFEPPTTSDVHVYCLHYQFDVDAIKYNADGSLNEDIEDDDSDTVALSITDLGSASFPSTKLLYSQACFLFSMDDRLFYWLGSDTDDLLRKAVVSVAQELTSQPLYKVNQGLESGFFKIIFRNWEGRQVRSPEIDEDSEEESDEECDEEDPLERIKKKQEFIRPLIDDDVIDCSAPTDGKIEVYHLCETNIQTLSQQDVGHFYSTDSYVIVLTQLVERLGASDHLEFTIYFWKGSLSPPIHAIQFQTVLLPLLKEIISNSGGGDKPKVWFVNEGEETGHFIALLNGFFVSHFKKNLEVGLYQISGKSSTTRATQVHPRPLSSNLCFLLYSPTYSYLWLGEDCGKEERDSARELVGEMFKEVKELVETQKRREPGRFVSLLRQLGGKLSHLKRPFMPRLFTLKVTNEGKVYIYREPIISKSLLHSRSVNILDCSAQIFVWKGTYSSELLTSRAIESVEFYLAFIESDASFSVISQGEEPLDFIAEFAGWIGEIKKSKSETFYDPLAEKRDQWIKKGREELKKAHIEKDKQRRYKALLYHLLLSYSYEKNFALQVLVKITKFMARSNKTCEFPNKCYCSFYCMYQVLEKSNSVKYEVRQILNQFES